MTPLRIKISLFLLIPGLFAVAPAAAAGGPPFDVIIRGGTVYDGSGDRPLRADVGSRADEIAMVGDLSRAQAATVVEAKGLAVAPGFINMLSGSPASPPQTWASTAGDG